MNLVLYSVFQFVDAAYIHTCTWCMLTTSTMQNPCKLLVHVCSCQYVPMRSGVNDAAMLPRYVSLAERFPRSNLLQMLMLQAAPVEQADGVEQRHTFVPLAHRYLVARVRKGSPSLYVSLRTVLEDPAKVCFIACCSLLDARCSQFSFEYAVLSSYERTRIRTITCTLYSVQ